MSPFKTIIVTLFLIGSFLIAWTAIAATSPFQEKDNRRRVKRVERPSFTEKDDGMFFQNVFEDALTGDRPSVADLETQIVEQPTTGTENSGSGSFAWSNYIDGDVLETEVKRMQSDLMQQVTSPTKYSTEYKDARESFARLSMIFGIILEHDQEVRWKRAANLAQPSFAKAAKNARRGDKDSFEYAVARRDDLAELIRGGNMTSNEKPVDSFEWASVISRSSIMSRLQVGVDRIKPMLSNQDEFNSNIEEVLHEASLIAAMSEVLAKPSMDEADEEEDYVVYTRSMSAGATEIMEAVRSNQYEAASGGFNKIMQSCSNCHEIWN